MAWRGEARACAWAHRPWDGLTQVVYRLQGSPQLELLEDRLEWPQAMQNERVFGQLRQVLVNITVNQSLIFRNSGHSSQSLPHVI